MLHQLSVPGMHCEKCVDRINKALGETGITFTVSLADKTVTVDGCDHCLKTAVDTLDDLGFEVTQMG